MLNYKNISLNFAILESVSIQNTKLTASNYLTSHCKRWLDRYLCIRKGVRMNQVIEKLKNQIKDCLDSNDFVGAKNQLDKIVAISEPVLPEIVKG